MSLSDIKHALRKCDFPLSAKEAMIKIEQLLSGRGAPSNKQLDMAMEIIAEFVFCETDRRGNRRTSSMTPLQELQLIDVICNFLSGPINETTKNTIFLSLFSGSDSEKRAKILNILSSMAVSASSTPMLLAVGVWLQQTGCSSPQSLQLVENVIRDHFTLNTCNQTVLRSLANVAPQFVANFIAAVTELYMQDMSVMKLPPKNLLEVITFWVYSNPSLCVSAQLNPAALPSGAIPMAAVTPLAGLIRWCSLASLYVDEDTEMIEDSSPPKKIKMEVNITKEPIFAVKPATKSLSERELYLKLHLGVLNSLRAGKRTQGPPTAVNAQNLVALISAVQNYVKNIPKDVDVTRNAKLQDCLDRIGQAVQVALASGCVYGNINNLLSSLNPLPENRLLGIVIRMHQQTI